MAESMVFYKSFYESLNGLPDDIRLKMLDAIIGYALNGTEPQLEGFGENLFALIRPQLDANAKRRENGKYGVLGGRPKKKAMEDKKKPIGLSVVKPNGLSNENPNVNENVNVNVNVNENVNNTSSSSCACTREENGEDFDVLLESFDEYRKRNKQRKAQGG